MTDIQLFQVPPEGEDCSEAMAAFLEKFDVFSEPDGSICINTPTRPFHAAPGDWIATGGDGALTVLNPMTKFLLDWLSREDSSVHGECRGAALEVLTTGGFAKIIHPERGDYARVSLTEAGHALHKAGQAFPKSLDAQQSPSP